MSCVSVFLAHTSLLTLWSTQLKTAVNWQVVGAFVTVVLLHALWDIFNSLRGATFIASINLELLSMLVAYTSLTLLNRRVSEAKSPPI